jgi:hypothetical protein
VVPLRIYLTGTHYNIEDQKSRAKLDSARLLYNLTSCACYGVMYMTKTKEVISMDKNSFWFQMKVASRERKEVAGLIASHFGTQAVYRKTPSFEYLINESDDREWRVDKNGAILVEGTAEDSLVKRFEVLKALEAKEVTAPGQVLITLTIDGHNGVTLRNLINILASKEKLILKALGHAQAIISPTMVTAI